MNATVGNVKYFGAEAKNVLRNWKYYVDDLNKQVEAEEDDENLQSLQSLQAQVMRDIYLYIYIYTYLYSYIYISIKKLSLTGVRCQKSTLRSPQQRHDTQVHRKDVRTADTLAWHATLSAFQSISSVPCDRRP